MKKTLVLIALFVGFMGFSQKNDSNKDVAMELVKLQTEGQFEVMLAPYLERIPAENREAFQKDVTAALPKLYEEIAKVYRETYSKEEMAQIIDFYHSPAGKKMIKVTPIITQKTLQAAQAWGMNLRPLLQKYGN